MTHEEIDSYGCALIMSVENGFIETTQLILDKNIPFFNEYVELALKYATHRGHLEIIKLLQGALK